MLSAATLRSLGLSQEHFMTLKTLAVALLLGASVTLAQAPAHAQTDPAAAADKPLTVADLANLRAELQSSKKQLTASLLVLTDAEATRFWPIYDRYAAETAAIRDGQATLVAEYVNTFGKYDDKTAADFIARWIDIDAKTTALRARYVPIVGKALPGVKAASFFQIDRRISMAVDLKVASAMPLVQSQAEK
jgi:hypothetical protein